MTHIPEISAENPYQQTGYHKPARKQNIVLLITENRYKKNSVLNCMSDAPEMVTGFMVIFWADFRYVCHWH